MPQKEIEYDDQYLSSLEAADDSEISPAEFDPDADYAKPAPPILDGWYSATVSNAGVKVDDTQRPFRTSKWSNETRIHYELSIKAELHAVDDPIVDGKTVWTDRPLRTAIDPDRGNTSGVASAFRAITGKPILGLNELKHAEQLNEVLQEEPLCWVRIQNILADTDAEIATPKGEKRPKKVYGQKRIMALRGGTDSQGKFTGVGDHPSTSTRCVARPRIVEFRNKSWEGPTAD